MLTITDYRAKVLEIGFDEFPLTIYGGEKRFESFIDFSNADPDLRIHLSKVILRRCFSATFGDLTFIWDYNWFIAHFLASYDTDFVKPALTTPIREAFEMINANDPFSKGIMATTFMFGVIEFYVKHELGFRPREHDFFDKAKKDYFRKLFTGEKKPPSELTLGMGIELLMQQDTEIAKALRELEHFNIARLQFRCIQPGTRWIYPELSKRLNLFRNTMLHGESHSFYSAGHYLLALYSLFHLCHQKRIEQHLNQSLEPHASL